MWNTLIHLRGTVAQLVRVLAYNAEGPFFCDFCKKFPETIIHVFCECDYVKPIWDDLIKIIKDKHDIEIFLFQTLKRCLEFSRIILLHIYFFVWNTIFMYVNLEARNPHLLGTQVISRVIEKLNIILPKRGGNFQIILRNGGLIFNFFFLQYHFLSCWSTLCFSTLTRLFI